MEGKHFYKEVFQESGTTDQTYKAISQTILGDDQLSEAQKVYQLQQMNEAYQEMLNADQQLDVLN
ncbi:hypothetical protein [Marinicrinis lubricantis]|uniref:Uncharacterized protein n=1 Tax=Marinicrinis lubricantis TaxID=2086470 RepID=A0ABW1IVR5_9BACL